MKYINAAEVLPEKLLMKIQVYVNGEILYVPKASTKKQWGEASGAKAYYMKRNQCIKEQFRNGKEIELIASQYGLAFDTIKKIIYK